MKDLMRYFGKALLIIMYPILIVVLIVLVVVLIQQTNENRKAYKAYENLHSELNIPVDKKDSAVDGINQVKDFAIALRNEFVSAQDEIKSLENQVETEQKDGYGEIRGSILPFVTSGTGFNQYQRVCAESVENKNIQYCVSVSAIQEDFVLVVPEGQYYVFSTIQNNPELGQAYYTKYIECSNGAEGQTCTESLSKENVTINIESGGTVLGVDPADWSNVTISDSEDE